jgi:adenine phosphoribosyltransferase
MDLLKTVRTVPHFPKQGIMFRDVTTLWKDKDAFAYSIQQFVNRYKGKGIDKVAGVEARGLVLAGAIAAQINAGCIPLRKAGKLPAETIQETYGLEYKDKEVLQVHKDAISQGERVLLVDDLLATGGTALAAASLIKRLGGVIHECAFVIDLPDLKGKEKLVSAGLACHCQIAFDGH